MVGRTLHTFLFRLKRPELSVIVLLASLASGCSSQAPAGKTARNASDIVNASTSQCDPNYSGCVPIAPDVDCLGGGGNGHAYVKGPVRVIGRDVYGLDRDGDGVGCD